ncbi:ATP-binding cassette domain-containing protein [Dehalococcoidia bacterium]|nr:ATP-binding cassette domain-containing protein [Dehalococcoidia bacterium]
MLQGVSKRFGTKQAVGTVTLSLYPGESVALLGPSGSGKTTLLLMAAGEIRPTTGRVLLQGLDVGDIKAAGALARLVGTVHQQFDLVPNLSALQNVLAGRLGRWGLVTAMLSLLWPQERGAALAMLEKVGLEEDVSRLRVGNLSGGEQQRVAIGRLLIQDPALMVVDEPVSSLDVVRAEEIMGLLAGMAEGDGKTVIGSMHSVNLARRYFKRLVGLRNGQIQFDCPAADVEDEMLRDLYDIHGLRGEW